MNVETLAAKVREYAPSNELEQHNVLQELLQQLVLASLSQAGFFQVAAFHGGTCLRILHALPRFSEDLDFVLKEPDPRFRWSDYRDALLRQWCDTGLDFEFQDRTKTNSAVRKAFLKTDSIGELISVRLPVKHDKRRAFRIRLEVDTKPPEGAAFETRFITFPYPASITTQTLASSFASKSHALLCRNYVKGRDWFDFLWYAERNTPVHWPLLRYALAQVGPWQGQTLEVDRRWYLTEMKRKIREIDWQAAVEDVRRFLPTSAQRGLDVWGTLLFEDLLDRWNAGQDNRHDSV